MGGGGKAKGAYRNVDGKRKVDGAVMVPHHLFFSSIRCLGLVIGRGMKTKPCRNKLLLDVKTHIFWLGYDESS